MSTITGKVIRTFPLQEGSGKDGKAWSKTSLVIETNDKYPTTLKVDVWGENVSKAMSFAIGDTVEADYYGKSREYQDKWYTDCQATALRGTPSGRDVNGANPDYVADPIPDDGNLPF